MKSITKLLKSCTAIFLAAVMVFNMSANVFAATATDGSHVELDINGDGTINYVSFGDSVTNGYGMTGYRYEDGTNVFGFRREVPGSYPVVISEYLEEQGYEVNLEQLAISGFRMDELHWMLCDDYEPDFYHTDYFKTWNQKPIRRILESESADAQADKQYLLDKYLEQYGTKDNMVTNADAIIMAEYREAVKNADFITIDLGTNNFGTFLTSTLASILTSGNVDIGLVNSKTDFSNYLDPESAASLEGMIDQMAAQMAGCENGPDYKNMAFVLIRTLARCMLFGYLGFTEHYDGALDAIYEINPNVQILVLDMYTMISGVELVGNALGADIDINVMYNLFIDMANFYANELSPYAQKVTHASLETDPALLIDDYVSYKYPENQGTLVQALNSEDYNITAVTLLNEFIMENLEKSEGVKYDADNPDDRALFEENVASKVNLLDGYIYHLQNTVKTMVLDEEVIPQIKEAIEPNDQLVRKAIDAIELIYTSVDGVALAEELVPTAIEGVKTAEAAVQTARKGVKTAEAAVQTAVDGVAAANNLANIIINDVVGNSMFSTSSGMKSIIISVIKSKVSEMDLTQYGFDNEDETVDMLSEKIYDIACLYVNTKDAKGEKEARKTIVIEIIKLKLENSENASGTTYTPEEAEKTAKLAYEIDSVYDEKGEKEAVLYAMETEITDELVAQLGVTTKREAAEKAYAIAKMNDKDAVIAAMQIAVDEETAVLGYAINEVYQSTEGTEEEKMAAAIIYAVASKLTDEQAAALGEGKTKEDVAALAYQVAKLYNGTYDAVIANGGDEAAAKETATVKCLVTVGTQLGMDVTEDSATLAYTVYTNAYLPTLESGKTETEAKDAAVIMAIAIVMNVDFVVAEGLFGIYKDRTDLTYDQEIGAYRFAMIDVAEMDATLVNTILDCYRLPDGVTVQGQTNYDGLYKEEKVQNVIKFFMTTMGIDTALFDSYLMYKTVAETLGKIARLDTIYFDALLSGAINVEEIGAKLVSGQLALDKPEREEGESDEAYEARVATSQFAKDSSLAIFYFRFMAGDGVFTHPSIAGHTTFVASIKEAMNKMVPYPEKDNNVIITDDTSILAIGDAVINSNGEYTENNYTELIAEKLGVTNVNYVQNEFARLEDFYHALAGDEGDAFAQNVVGEIDKTELAKQIEANDIILVNLGSMNLGYSAMQLVKYMNDGSTYKMTFADKENMSVRNLGATVDAFLTNFQSMVGVTEGYSDVGAIMLLLESYGYGITTFANDFNNLMDKIHELNPDAAIVLTGVGDIAGDAYLATYEEDGTTPTTYLALGNFYQHGAELMNGHMEKYAAQTANVFYMDTMDAENPAQINEPVNIASGEVGSMLTNAHFTETGHATVAGKFNCENFGVHFINDQSKEATCTKAGCIDQACVLCDEEIKDSIPALGHDYGSPVWNWSDDLSKATATFTCTRTGCTEAEEGHSATVEAVITFVTTDSGCVKTGKTVYTAEATIYGTPYYNEKTVELPAKGHTYGAPVWTWNDELTEATATFACTVDGCKGTATEKASGDAIVTNVTKDATCVEAGTKELTATVTFNETAYTDTKSNIEIPSTGVHNYKDGECTMCGDIEHKVDCTYKEETALKAGELTLALGGTEVGTYTFEEVNGGWAIKGANGYLALADGALVTSSTPFAWTYANGMFSATETTEEESSNNWWGNIFGGIFGGGNTTTTTTTYYLTVSGTALTVSTETTGAATTFYVKHNDGNANHNYVETVVKETCTTEGYTKYTCTKCGTSYTKNVVPATGHNYTSKVTAPTCTTPGYTEYTCQNGCGDKYVSDETPATGHNFENGTCTLCGEPEEGECVGTKEVSITSGLTAELTLNGASIGTFTFTQVDGGWTIRATDGTYLGKDGAYSNEAFVWAYSNNSFSYTVTIESSSNNWFSGIFGNWFGKNETTTTYYLTASNGVPAVSTSAVTAKFLVESVGEHVYGNPVSKDGMHVYTCTVCGHTKSVVCTDDNCTLCHPVTPEEPEVKISVSVNVTSSNSSSGNWFENIFGGIFGSSFKKTYTATINVTAEGTEVKKVEYSTDGSNWKEGTSFTSNSNITKFYIRVTGTNDETYEFTYENGTVTENPAGGTTPDVPVAPEEDDDNSSSGNWWDNIFGGFGNWFN